MEAQGIYLRRLGSYEALASAVSDGGHDSSPCVQYGRSQRQPFNPGTCLGRCMRIAERVICILAVFEAPPYLFVSLGACWFTPSKELPS